MCGGDLAWIQRCCDGADPNATAPADQAAAYGGGASSVSSLQRMVGEWTVAYDQVMQTQ